jgi:hypothetical protein
MQPSISLRNQRQSAGSVKGQGTWVFAPLQDHSHKPEEQCEKKFDYQGVKREIKDSRIHDSIFSSVICSTKLSGILCRYGGCWYSCSAYACSYNHLPYYSKQDLY